MELEKKKAVIIHGWGEGTDEPLLQYVKKELENKEYGVVFEDMPDTESPNVEKWTSRLREAIKPGTSIVVAHSIGCLAFMKFLEKQNFDSNKEKIGKAIFIAPWIEVNMKAIEEEGEESVQVVKRWREEKVDWIKARDNCREFVCIFSDNDPFVLLTNKEIFKVELNAKTILLHARGHFDSDYGINDLPEIKQFID